MVTVTGNGKPAPCGTGLKSHLLYTVRLILHVNHTHVHAIAYKCLLLDCGCPRRAAAASDDDDDTMRCEAEADDEEHG